MYFKTVPVFLRLSQLNFIQKQQNRILFNLSGLCTVTRLARHVHCLCLCTMMSLSPPSFCLHLLEFICQFGWFPLSRCLSVSVPVFLNDSSRSTKHAWWRYAYSVTHNPMRQQCSTTRSLFTQSSLFLSHTFCPSRCSQLHLSSLYLVSVITN